jgi:hypothetical protein
MTKMPPVCDYEGSDYRTRFWENQGRDYEDQVERVALRRLMPDYGSTLIDIGAGFGRLADEYAGYDRVVLFDYSSSLLREAHERLGNDPRFILVSGNWYEMPFVDGLFQTLVQIRTIHHAANVPGLFAELNRIARINGSYVLEFANKRNLKSIGRYLLKRQTWSPFAQEPVEFVELNFDFHPKWMREQLIATGFTPQRTLSSSHFRIPFLKDKVPTELLVKLDKAVQPTGQFWQLTPQTFILSENPKHGKISDPDHFFACPKCKTPIFEKDETFTCERCGKVWKKEDGVYIFK